MKAPACFISHGAPTFALEPGRLGPALSAMGRRLHELQAVLIVSPHWQTPGHVAVMRTREPATMHDFGGFSPALHALRYPAPGAPAIAEQAAKLLVEAGFDVSFEDQRGLDHGAWVPLRHLLPEANVPAFQVSLPMGLATPDALRLGAALAPLRDRGVAVIGSGSMTHNLYEFRQHVRDPDYAREFAEWIRDAITRGDVDSVLRYRERAPHAARAHPTEEHFLPLLVALGAAGGNEAAMHIDGGMTYGTLSMDSYVWGMPSTTAVSASRT